MFTELKNKGKNYIVRVRRGKRRCEVSRGCAKWPKSWEEKKNNSLILKRKASTLLEDLSEVVVHWIRECADCGRTNQVYTVRGTG